MDCSPVINVEITRMRPRYPMNSSRWQRKKALFWKGLGTMQQGCAFVLNAQPSDAVGMITSGMDTRELTGAILWVPYFLSYLARAYAELGNFEDARRSIREA